MQSNPFTPKLEELPDILPVFPLPEAMIMPGTQLPLNIFESRYLNMVSDALAAGRMFGMIQPHRMRGSHHVVQRDRRRAVFPDSDRRLPIRRDPGIAIDQGLPPRGTGLEALCRRL